MQYSNSIDLLNAAKSITFSSHKADLPILEYLIENECETLLDDVCIIGAQHLLKTTHSMFQSMCKLGLKAENVFLMGKCYSSNNSVLLQMLNDGFNISPRSTFFNSHESFDVFYKNEIDRFYKKIINKINKINPKKIIILDDGGEFLAVVKPEDFQCNEIIGIEQTTSGYRKLINCTLSFPVINVARSWAKLKYESPIISIYALQKLDNSISSFPFPIKNALILGGGAIGSAIKSQLDHKFQIDVFDVNSKCSSVISLNEKLPIYDLIIGCTGATSLTHSLHSLLKKGTTLASVSSSDREFDAFHLRKQIPAYSNCHSNVIVNNIMLLNSGFPINFDGNIHSVPPKYIQLTRALLLAAILQARRICNSSSGMIDLCIDSQQNIVDFFISKILSMEEMKIFYNIPDNHIYQSA